MFKRPSTWFVISLLCMAGAWYFWKLGDQWAAQKRSVPPAVPATVPPASPVSVTKTVSAATALLPRLTAGLLAAQTQATPVDPLAYRLSNTTRPLGELLRRDHALLLENALIDTETPVSFAIPPHLRGPAEPGSYLVQARGTIDEDFRARLRAAGATVVAYIPNNAYLVRASTTGAARLAAFAETQVVLPYEPYYKLEAELLRAAVDLEPLPDDVGLNLVLFADAAEATKTELAALGVEIFAEERSPFGPVVRVSPPTQGWYAVATLPGVQTVELVREREAANDLTRVRLAISSTPQATTNWLGLTGSNVLVNVNDSWQFTSNNLPEHPDLTNRVIYGTPYSLVDSNGHATHVAATIAGSGAVSPTVTDARGSNISTNNPSVDGQFRGMAPGASIFALPLNLGSRPGQNFGGPVSDTYLQETAAGTNALISNNSWHYAGAARYSLAAASYDAAVRDALPGVTGSQPLVYVFAAGNVGGGRDDGQGGRPDRVQSPGTAKNVITVGALEQLRDITNEVWICSPINLDTNGQPICTTNTPWREMTSDSFEVAGFSSRGNTGVGVEGDYGRFKPDVVAPGTFVVSARSQYWNESEYYNPTNYTTTTRSPETVAGTNINFYSVFVPENAVGLNLTVVSDGDLRIRVWQGKNPEGPEDFSKLDKQVTAPPDGGANFGPVNTTWWYSVANTNVTQTNTYALIRTLITTNDLGNYYEVLSNLNNSISGNASHYYRYESGSSMAAAAVSGSLALMQEFFEQRLQRTNSPALMKALLINGARPAGPLYFSQVLNSINYQGWGVARVRNSLPSSLTNFVAGAATSMWVVDQSPTNALTTGQSRTHTFTVNNNAARNQPLRVTLVWTDPPGSPAAAVKLVNDLDLIVTNTDTKEVFFGNMIEAGNNFSTPWLTNGPPLLDVVNNVENVYLFPPLDTNFTVTVRARHVNVNAVTGHTNDLVQDYALVISSGDGQVSGALTVNPTPVFLASPEARMTYVTNTFGGDKSSGFLLDYQRVGANTPLLGNTNGMTNQWHFYVVTNTTSFTNAAFVTFVPTDLAIPRIGVREALLNNATRIESDIDMYVSTDFELTNLSPVAVAGAFQSRGRTGTEQVVFSNAVQNQVYYIGVKAEDQMAAEYSFFGVFSLIPFGDDTGNVPCFNVPQAIPDRSPDNVQGQINAARAICPCVMEGDTRRVVVTNTFTHEHFEDLIGNVAHGQRFAVLNNHRFPPPAPLPPGPYSFIYEDNGEGDIVPAVNQELLISDGPGSLRDFVGEPRVGPWIFTFLDDAWTQTGQVDQVELRLDPVFGTNDVVLGPSSWHYEVVNVGIGATNLTVCVAGNTAPVELYIRKGGFPTRTAYDQSLTAGSPGACLQVTLSSLPPLSAGRYFIGVFNPSTASQTVRITATVEYDLNAVVPINWSADGDEYLLDDAVTNSTIFVTNRARIAAVEVGVRMDHPRVSDLALTLISPRGTRVLLTENRGMTDNQGMGSTLSFTNVVPVVVTNGGSLAVTNVIPTGSPAGSLTIDYDFLNVPDRMTVYYENVRLLDTGFISGNGQTNVTYGPGTATDVVIVMNEGGNTNSTTQYSYTVSDIGVTHNYLTFTENTNRTLTPIKFAPPPFVNPVIPLAFLSGFEPAVARDYVSPEVVDGWDVLSSNRVSVLGDPLLAHTGVKSLALLTGTIRRTLATSAGGTYRLDFAYRSPPKMGNPLNWWPAENNAIDIVGGVSGQLNSGAAFANGLVGRAFTFDGADDTVTYPIAALLTVTNSFTMEFWARPTAARMVTTETTDNTNVEGTVGQRYAIFPANGEGLPFSLVGAGVSVGTNGISVGEHSGYSLPMVLVYNAPISGWTHIAVVYENRQPRLYVNGVLVRTGLTGTLNPCPSLALGGGGSIFGSYGHFRGDVDEYAIFDRVLTDAQIQDIYRAGAAGKCGMIIPPTICVSTGAQVFVPGVVTNQFSGTSTNWVTNSLAFSATANGTPVGLSPRSAGPSGVLLDTFTLTASSKSLYYLPEERLSVLADESAFGQWSLEIWDSRTGETNQVSLLSWQLSFVFQNESALPAVLQPGVAQTNTIPPGQIIQYMVDAPFVARFATNQLFNATSNLNFYFNQNAPPGFGGVNPGDVVFTQNDTDHTEVLSTTNTAPPASLKTDFIAGRRYYLAIENSNTVNVTYSILVDFDLRASPLLVALTNGVRHCTVNPMPLSLDHYYFQVSTNARRAQFALLNPSGDLTLLLRRGLPPALTLFDYDSANPGSSHEVITVFDYSQPVPLTPGDWYVAAANLSTGAVSYCVQANEWFVYGTNITIINTTTNAGSLCFTWASLPDVLYYVQGSVDNVTWDTISPTIIAVGFSTTYCIPLPTPYQFFRVREGVGLDPVTLPPVITSVEHVFNGIRISWGRPSYGRFQVQWKPVLDGTTNWNTFTNLITSPTGFHQFLDDGSQTGGFDPMRYYRLLQLP